MLPGGPVVGVAFLAHDGTLMAKRVGPRTVVEVYDRGMAPQGGVAARLVEIREHDERAFVLEPKGGGMCVETLAPMLDKMQRLPGADEINAALAKSGLEAALLEFEKEVLRCVSEPTPESDTPSSSNEPS